MRRIRLAVGIVACRSHIASEYCRSLRRLWANENRWPVIIAIVVVSLIILSIVTCMVRCLCLGYSCCCTCFKCLSCCGCCHDCCDGKRNKPHKYTDKNASPFSQQYASPAMMTPASGGPPQYAQFEVGKNGLAVTKPVSEDALPPMPSWDTASKKHVLAEDEKNNVEMGDLDPATGQNVPLMTGANAASIAPPSPHEGTSPIGPRPGQGVNGNGYMGIPNRSPNNGGGYRGTPGPGYGPPSPGGMSGPPRHGSPAQFQNDGFTNQAVGGGRPPMQNQYSNNPAQRFPPQPQRQYSNTTTSSRPPYSERNYSDNSFNSNFSRGPQRGPMISPPPARMPSPGGVSGFDFGPGVASRPSPGPSPYGSGPTQGGYNRGSPAPLSYATNPPPPQPQHQQGQQQEQLAYPGYRPYQPQRPENGGANNGAWTPRALMPGREVQGWDPVPR